MKYLEESLSVEDYDKVRLAMGLEPKAEARAKGAVKSAEMVKDITEKTKK